CATYLKARFAGMPLEAIPRRLLELMREEKALYDSLLRNVLAVGQQAFASGSEEASLYLDGTANMLEQPGFEDLDRMRALFKTFEQKSRLVRILNACIAGDGMRIVIGHENPHPELHDTALVTATYPLDGESGMGLGVLGSTRLPHPHVLSLPHPAP